MMIHRDRPSDAVQAAKDSPPLRGRPGKAAGGVEHLGRASWPARRRSPSQPPSPADPGHLRLRVRTLTLAFGAEEGGPARIDQPANRRAAMRARQALAAIDPPP